ncbi:hypothetical protein BT96DRAFT_433694 [Gymnopus androsaceus JB14]|uniref:Uncharacterized protein n=1 Tax=Gymnopus androsaceus JB14 TaxID=1447944 RepID=A0A6A4I513_9AGAR|nr:hypothetical protein BT96DRAFT_433694 [Gymnopus androsaceus JB14]
MLQAGSQTGAGTTSKLGQTLPSFEVVKAPRGIDLQDLKEQMDRDLDLQQQHGSHSHSRTASRPRSGSASAAMIRRDSGDRDADHGRMSSAVSAPMLAAIPVVVNAIPSSSMATRPGAALLPLRSALKNPSRTPSPMSVSSGSQVSHPVPVGMSGLGGAGTSLQQQLSSVRAASPLATMTRVPNGDIHVKGKGKAVDAAQDGTQFRKAPDSDSDSDSDAASISSYETGHERFDDGVELDSGEETETGHNGIDHLHRISTFGHGHDDDSGGSSDVSHSGSTETPMETQNVTDAPAPTTPPKRRKSVRVSLQPTFSATPPAIEYEETEEEEGEENRSQKANGHANGDYWGLGSSHTAAPQDIWADSSDEDVEYQQARTLLSKFSTKKHQSDGGRKSKVQR